MSPRAACRLVTLGFTEVYDYVAGKVDWLARNQPIAGDGPGDTIGAHLRHDAVTIGPDEPLDHVRDRVDASPHPFALVITTGGVLLGRLRPSVLRDTTDPDAAAATVMEPGPSTLRPHQPVAEVRAHLQDKGLTYAIVTDPDGQLLGTVHPDDLAPSS